MHILIIEDDGKTAEFVVGAFRQSGYATTLCSDGEEGGTGYAADLSTSDL